MDGRWKSRNCAYICLEKTIDMRKKLYFILLGILPVLALASCNKEKDDNQPVGYSEAIIGSWQSTERTFAEYKDGEQVMDGSHYEDVTKFSFKKL